MKCSYSAEPQPYAKRHQPHHNAGVVTPEKLAVEPHHSPVFVPFHKYGTSPAARPLIVDDGCIGYEKNLPSLVPEAHTPIQIFTMEKIILVPKTHIFNCIPTHQHESAGNSLHLKRTIRQRLLVQMEIEKQPWPIAAETVQPKGADEGTPGGRHGAPAPRLLGAVLVDQ